MRSCGYWSNHTMQKLDRPQISQGCAQVASSLEEVGRRPEGAAHNPIATVKFEHNGEKKIMLNYAKLRILE